MRLDKENEQPAHRKDKQKELCGISLVDNPLSSQRRKSRRGRA
jgi:hypothetical protein